MKYDIKHTKSIFELYSVIDFKANQLCLRLDAPDRELEKRYESTLDECYTQTMFWKMI